MKNQLKKGKEIFSNYSEAQIQNILHQAFHFYMPFTNLVWVDMVKKILL